MKSKEIVTQIIRFGLAGGIGVLAGYFTLYGMTEYLGIWYLFSSITAGIVNGVINFFLEKFWAFKNKDKESMHKQAAFFFFLKLSIFFANIGLLYVCVEYIHMNYLWAQLMLVILLSIVSYFFSRIIFKNKTI